MLALLTLVVIGIVGYACWREGVLTAFSILCNVFLAGLVAFNFFEPLAEELGKGLEGSFLVGYEDAICLMMLFAGTLALLRVLAYNAAPRQLQYHPILQQGGAVFCALVAGYLVSGFLICLLQTLPLPEKFLGFDPYIAEGKQGFRSVVPSDRVWLALMHRGSVGPLSGGEVTEFDSDGSFEFRYARLRRIKDTGDGSSK